jgi:hypothetical protein
MHMNQIVQQLWDLLLTLEIKDVITWVLAIIAVFLAHWLTRRSERQKYEQDRQQHIRDRDEDSQQRDRQRDKEFLSFCRGLFFRQAFWGYYVAYSSQEEFRKEIENVSLALRTGFSRTRSGVPVRQMQGGYETISNSSWRKILGEIHNRLLRILTIMQNGRDDSMESIMFTADQFRQNWSQPGAIVVHLLDGNKPFSNYLREQFSPDTLKLLDEYDIAHNRKTPRAEAPLPKTLREALAGELNVLIKKGVRICDLQMFDKSQLVDFDKALLEQNLQGEDLIRLNRYLMEDAYRYVVPRSMEAGINRERDEIISQLNNIWNDIGMDELKIPTTVDSNYNDLSQDDR